MDAEKIWGIVRTILAAVGGFFVARGKIDNETLTQLLAGAGTLFVAIWSWLSKKPA